MREAVPSVRAAAPFHGWRIVGACMLFVTISWSLDIFGMGVYIHALTSGQGFSVSTVSTAVTTAYVVSALLMVSVGRFIARRAMPEPTFSWP